MGKEILELPAGKLEGDESPELRGRKELEEETGYRAGQMISAGLVYASVGYTSEIIHMFIARDLEEVGQALEFDEEIETVIIPLEKIKEMLSNNEIHDSKTIAGLQKLLVYLNRECMED